MVTIINKRLWVAVVFLFLTASCATPGNQPISLQIQNYYQNGLNAFKQGAYKKAASFWQEGLSLVKTNQEYRHWAERFLIDLARAAESSGNYTEAIQLAQRAQNASSLASKILKAEAHVIIGQAYRHMADYSNAQNHSESARQIAREVGSLELESDSIRNLGAIHKNQGRFDRAQIAYQESLSLAVRADDKELQAKALNNLGELSQRKGQYSNALMQYQQSLELRTAIDDLAGQGSVLGNVCRIYQDLNQLEPALRNCERALKIAQKIGASAQEANHLNNIAGIYWRLGKFNKAKNFFHQSVAIKHKINDRDGEARAFNNIALIFKSEGNLKKALEYFSNSLAIKKQIDDRSGQSATYYNLGWTYSDFDQPNQALDNLEQALLIQLELGEPGLLWRIYDKLSNTHHQLKRPELAVFYGKLAVNSIQSLRSENQKLDKHLRQSLLEDKRVVYEQLANLLIDQDRLSEAQQIMDMLKEEEYFDFLRRQAISDTQISQTTYTTTEAKQENRYRQLTARLVELSTEYSKIKTKKELGQTLSSKEKDRFDHLKAYLKEVRKGYDKFLEELEQIFAQENYVVDFSERDLDKINQTQYLLGEFEHTVLAYYLYTNEKLRILLTDSNLSTRPILYEVLITRSELNHLIFSFREKISALDDTFSEEAEQLYNHLIAPMKTDLDRLNAKTLLLFPSRSLRYLPFAALNDGQHYLVEQYALVMYNAAADRRMLSEKPQRQWNIAGFGVSHSRDPDFSDLPAVEYELDVIVKEKPDDETEKPDEIGILPGNQYINLAFTADRLMNTMSRKNAYQVFHLASHFKLTPGSKEHSFLLAGDGNHISLSDFDYDDYQMAGKDLITLSACETALGQLDSPSNDGREIETLGTLMQEKGAHAVLATLWAVADQSTAVFMEEFYKLRESSRLTKAEAIRQAQLLFIQGKVFRNNINNKVSIRGVKPTEEIPYSQLTHVYYWAPFILMGNWQ